MPRKSRYPAWSGIALSCELPAGTAIGTGCARPSRPAPSDRRLRHPPPTDAAHPGRGTPARGCRAPQSHAGRLAIRDQVAGHEVNRGWISASSASVTNETGPLLRSTGWVVRVIRPRANSMRTTPGPTAEQFPLRAYPGQQVTHVRDRDRRHRRAPVRGSRCPASERTLRRQRAARRPTAVGETVAVAFTARGGVVRVEVADRQWPRGARSCALSAEIGRRPGRLELVAGLGRAGLRHRQRTHRGRDRKMSRSRGQEPGT
jgi:hypothetical protein